MSVFWNKAWLCGSIHSWKKLFSLILHLNFLIVLETERFFSLVFLWKYQMKKSIIPHYLKFLIKLNKHSHSNSLKRDLRSISKITFYANLIVSPIDTELSGLKNKCCLLFKSAISWPEWGQLDGFAKWSFNFAKITSSLKKIKALYQ